MTIYGQPIDPRYAGAREIQQTYRETWTSGKSTLTNDTVKSWKEGTTPVLTTPGGYELYTFTLCGGGTSTLSADPGSGGNGGTFTTLGNITNKKYC